MTLRSNANYRSPRDVVDLLLRLGAVQSSGAPVLASSPFDSAQLEFLTYRNGDTSDMFARTKEAIQSCM
ncbi:nuclease, partial [Acinetobacter baumannii]|nr:nuclease [Acinetobacter baumannii]